MSFKDHFSAHSAAYVQGRPHYPAELFAYIASLTSSHELAVDCACGNGQASSGLAAHYAHVIANDASVQQLREAPADPRISFLACTAERQAVRSGAADLFVVAQAAHWFDFDRFYPEVQRVLKPGGVIVLIGYGLARVHPDIDAVVDTFYSQTVGPYWPPERHHLETGYRTLPLPLAELPMRSMTMTHRWSLDEYVAYLETWSAVQRYRKARRSDPLPALRAALEPLWSSGPLRNSEDGRRSVVWPLYLRAGHT